jgi:hypothetical protein
VECRLSLVASATQAIGHPAAVRAGRWRAPLLDHLVRAQHYRWGYAKADRRGGLALQPFGGRLENSSVEASLALRLMLLDLPQQAAPVARLWFCADERGCNLAQLGDADAAVS